MKFYCCQLRKMEKVRNKSKLKKRKRAGRGIGNNTTLITLFHFNKNHDYASKLPLKWYI